MTSPLAQRLIEILPRLRRFALSLSGAPEEADDLVQGACERALRGPIAWDPTTPLEHLMFRVIRNLWIDAVRRRAAHGHPAALDAVPDLPGEDGRRTADAKLAVADVGARVAELPGEQREVLLLVCVEEMTYREAADTLGVPIGTVMSRLARARVRLAELLEVPLSVLARTHAPSPKSLDSWPDLPSPTKH